jgi:hypothetical protein
VRLAAILEWTNDSTVIEEALASESSLSGLAYSYSCAPSTFDCKDPVAAALPLDCPERVVPSEDTYLNASCGDFLFDKRFGDGKFVL